MTDLPPSPKISQQTTALVDRLHMQVGVGHSNWSLVEIAIRSLYLSFFPNDAKVAHTGFNALAGFEPRLSVANAVVLHGLKEASAPAHLALMWAKLINITKNQGKRRNKIAHFSLIYCERNGDFLEKPAIVPFTSNRPITDAMNARLMLKDIEKMCSDWADLAQAIIWFGGQPPLLAWPKPADHEPTPTLIKLVLVQIARDQTKIEQQPEPSDG